MSGDLSIFNKSIIGVAEVALIQPVCNPRWKFGGNIPAEIEHMDQKLPANPGNRRFLLLQGPSSHFFNVLGRELREHGADVLRVTFCPGDRLYWSGHSIPFRARPEVWPEFLAQLLDERQITDLVCLGDGRFWHSEAIRVIRESDLNVRINVVEQGYLRPHWLTVEPDGTGGRSHIPEMFENWKPEVAVANKPATEGYRTSFLEYALLDIGYHLTNVLFGWLRYPRYKTHALDHPFREWAGWIKKALTLPWRNRERRWVERVLSAHDGPIYLFPLQLETDYQIRQHGPEGCLRQTLGDVIGSFAQNAPETAMLVVKVHPIDNGLAPWRNMVLRASEKHDCAERCVFLDGGNLEALMKRTSGVVTVNSTVGLSALEAGVPVKVLGRAIYDIDGLADQHPLSGFWAHPSPPEQKRVSAFVEVLKATVQVPGGFDGEGVKDGARNIAAKLLAPPDFGMTGDG